MISSHDTPGITIHPIPAAAAPSLRFTLPPPPPPPPPIASAIDLVWAELRQASPRLFDGPIVLTDTGAAVLGAAPLDKLPARRATYKTLATAADVGMTVRALGVQALVLARDAAGVEHILLGRRSSEVRKYPGLWENAPSGSVPPPPAAEQSVSLPHLARTLIAEGIEELGLSLSAVDMTCIALLDDAEAASLDVVLRVNLPHPINPKSLPCPATDGRWEYADAAWVPVAQLKGWVESNAHAISPPALAVLPCMGGTWATRIMPP